jgi:hypothetical protein
MLYVPGVALVPAEMVSVLVALLLAVVGLKDALTPVGKPEEPNVTVDANPPTTVN